MKKCNIDILDKASFSSWCTVSISRIHVQISTVSKWSWKSQETCQEYAVFHLNITRKLEAITVNIQNCFDDFSLFFLSQILYIFFFHKFWSTIWNTKVRSNSFFFYILGENMKYLCTFTFFKLIFFLLILAQFVQSMKYTSMCSESSNFLTVFYIFLGKIIKFKTRSHFSNVFFALYFWCKVWNMQAHSNSSNYFSNFGVKYTATYSNSSNFFFFF